MVFPTRISSHSPPSPTSRRLTSGPGEDDYAEAACRSHWHQPSGPRCPDTSESSCLNSSRSQSPAASTTSTTITLGGWSEESNVSSPDAGRQYLQLLTQTKPPPSLHRTYQLVVTQHPHTGAEFGLHDMSRIPLAPPLFVQLVVRNNVGAEVSADAELPFFVARITLHSAANSHRQDLSLSSQLYGTTISAPHNLRDRDGAPGAYFIFPDVGVRRRGRWRLHVGLLRIPQVGPATVSGASESSTCLAGVWTEPFDVVSAEGYVAPQITPLTRHFQSQGVRMFISSSVVPR